MINWEQDDVFDNVWYGDMPNDRYNFVLYLLDGDWVLAIFLGTELLFETPCSDPDNGKQNALKLLSEQLAIESKRVAELFSKKSEMRSPWN